MNWQFAEICGKVKGSRFMEGTVVWCCNTIIRKLKKIVGDEKHTQHTESAEDS